MKKLAGADVLNATEGRVAVPQLAWRLRSRRGRRTGHVHLGVLQEPGRPFHLLGNSRREVPGDQLQARGRRIWRPRERDTDATGIPPSEGNEVRRDGWWGVGASHSTDDAGEPTRGTPPREGGAGP